MTTYNHVYTNIYRELVNRIETAIDSGKLSEMDKSNFYLGDVESVSEIVNMPAIFMVFDGISESYEAQKRESKSGDVQFNFMLLYEAADAKLLQKKSLYYDDSNTKYTGFIPFIEAFLDVLHSDTSESVDPRTDNRQRRSMVVSTTRILKGKGFLQCEVNLMCRTKDFKMNRRYSD